MLIHSESLKTTNTMRAGGGFSGWRPNAIRLSDVHAWSFRYHYRWARKKGASPYVARRLIWESVFATHLNRGGTEFIPGGVPARPVTRYELSYP